MIYTTYRPLAELRDLHREIKRMELKRQYDTMKQAKRAKQKQRGAKS